MKNLPSNTDQDYYLWLLLGQVRDAILKARERELRQYNISARRARILFMIHEAGAKAMPTKILQWLVLERNTLSELLTRMEKKGLVRKVKDLDRKNSFRVLLTEKGREAFYQSTKRESIHKIMSALSAEERQQLESYLQTLRDKALEELD